MTRDMKSAGTGKTARPSSSKKSGGGMLIGVFIGLIIGVVAALGVALYINKTPMPFSNKAQPPLDGKPDDKAGKQTPPVALPGKPGDPLLGAKPGEPPAEAASSDTSVAKTAESDKAAEKPTDKAPSKAGDKTSDKPRFDFYKILPGNAESLPESKVDSKADAKREVKETVSKETVFLQAGSFQKANDAEGVKANLALIGLDASVQQVMVQDKVWYRVRLGRHPQRCVRSSIPMPG